MNYNFFLKTAFILSKESKCVSKQVGAILVHDYRIISTGYNGTPSGHLNCNEIFNINKFDREEHHQFSLQQELHSEQNCIAFAAKHGIPTENCTLFCTLEPCDDCLKLIIAAGIKNIFYLFDYDYSDKNNPLRQYVHIERINNDDINDFLLKIE